MFIICFFFRLDRLNVNAAACVCVRILCVSVTEDQCAKVLTGKYSLPVLLLQLKDCQNTKPQVMVMFKYLTGILSLICYFLTSQVI